MPPPAQETEKGLLQEAQLIQETSLKKLISFFLQADKERFIQENGYLANANYCQELAQLLGVEASEDLALEYLYNLIGLYLTVATYKQRIDRALKADSLFDMAQELDPIHLTLYDPRQVPVFLVYEYLTQLGLRPQQAVIFKEMLELDPDSDRYKSQVRQMLMGEGKTTIGAIIILLQAARHGRLSIFMTTPGLYDSTLPNLRKAFQELFDREVEEIDIPGDKILEMCGEIDKRLSQTMKQGDVLFVKAETCLCLLLKFRLLVFDIPNRAKNLPKINELRQILYRFLSCGEALIDEVDLVLSNTHEMNIPIGEKKYAKVERIQLLRKLFTLFDSQQVALGAQENDVANLSQLIGLQHNQQPLLLESDFKEIVARAVAWKFAKESPLLKLNHNEDFHLSFYRYINGTMNSRCQKILDHPQVPKYEEKEKKLDEQDKKDLAFLRYVRSLRYPEDHDPKKIEAAHQIALIKHMMITILPSTFKKKGNRHYGRGTRQPGEVGPYHDVDTPSLNYYGYIYEWLAFHFPTALQCKILVPQLAALGALYREGAEASLKAKRLVFDEKRGTYTTPEALEFKKYTNIDLELIDKPGKLEEGVAYIKTKTKSLLRLEAETAASQVSYHPYRLAANAFSIVNMFLSVRSWSATPDNAHCQEDCLADAYIPDLGTEGQIAVEILRQIEQEESTASTYILQSKTLEGILDTLLPKGGDIDGYRLFADSGSLLQDEPILSIIYAIRARVQKPILFFMGDTFTLLPLNSNKTIPIGGTDAAIIEAVTGLNENEYFVFLRARQGTGTNIKLPAQAKGIMTVDELIWSSRFFQTALRLRRILFPFSQTMSYAIPDYVLPTFPPSAAHHEKLRIAHAALLSSVIKQGQAKGVEYVRSRKQKIDSVFEVSLNNHLITPRDLTLQDLEKSDPYKAVMELPQEDDLYDQVGALEYAVETDVDLKAYGNARLALFRQAKAPEREALSIETKIEQARQKAAQSQWRPLKTMSPGAKELGMHVDIFVDINQNIQKDLNLDINTELLKQLELYEHASSSRARDEEKWDAVTIEACLSAFSQGLPFKPKADLEKKGNFLPILLPTLFRNAVYGADEQPFSALFSEHIYTTQAWAYPLQEPLPIFHKTHRFAENILFFKTENGWRALILSQQEANSFKSYLHDQYAQGKWQDVWLVLPDGSALEDHPKGQCPLHEISPLLLHINALNGTISYLEAHPDHTEAWFTQAQGKEAALKFLQLRIGRDPVKKKQFFASTLFGVSAKGHKEIALRHKYAHIEKMLKNEVQALGPQDRKTLERLSDRQINWITPEQVSLLHFSQIGKLRGRDLVSQIPEIHKHRIVPEQYEDLTELQKEWLPKPVVETPALSEPPVEPPVSRTPQPIDPPINPQDLPPISLAAPIIAPTPSEASEVTTQASELIAKPLDIPLAPLEMAAAAMTLTEKPPEPLPLQEHREQTEPLAPTKEISANSITPAPSTPVSTTTSTRILEAENPAGSLSRTPPHHTPTSETLLPPPVAPPAIPSPATAPTIPAVQTPKGLSDSARLVSTINSASTPEVTPPIQESKTKHLAEILTENRTPFGGPTSTSTALSTPSGSIVIDAPASTSLSGTPPSPHPVVVTTFTQPILTPVNTSTALPHPENKTAPPVPTTQATLSSSVKNIDTSSPATVVNTFTQPILTPVNTSAGSHYQQPNPIPLPRSTSPHQFTEITPESPMQSSCLKIVVIVTISLGALALTFVGIFGTLGGHISGSPYFMLTLSKALGPTYVSYILIGAAPVWLLIYQMGSCIKKRFSPLPQRPIFTRV